eukprot:CAMPEP_0115082496 /NCGR_PEP_ID=MMETSP0227-20121206/19939_1 /TAXON_ID=89957 /ORGANISM="Polarella glacialis, Strain CCMP 1383" /LENGTH=78 /DNA_ID=CAMNT_0002470603 /DNA_START=127 /DNA_END=363 /DNA_ORIENTATION=-
MRLLFLRFLLACAAATAVSGSLCEDPPVSVQPPPVAGAPRPSPASKAAPAKGAKHHSLLQVKTRLSKVILPLEEDLDA